MFRSYSREIPWVQYAPDPQGYRLECHACYAMAVADDESGVHRFAADHREHAAAPGHVGFGDLVARAAKPLARAMGRKPCTPCERRRRALNALRFRR